VSNLLIHPKTKADIDKYIESPSQVLTVVGADGTGTAEIAKRIAAGLLEVDAEKVAEHYKTIHITRPTGKQEIPIESVRSLIKQLRTKAPGEEAVKRIVLIEEAQRLSQEAQNALLKTLEQPNPDTIFIITLDSLGGVLPTVMSRSVKLVVHPVTLSQALAGYDSLPKTDVEVAWNISEGAAGLLHQLLTDEQESDLKLAIERAKDFISQDRYHRLLLVDELSKDRPALVVFLEALNKVLKAIHHSQVKKDSTQMSGKLLQARKLSTQTRQAVIANASSKLALLNLVESLEV
jgi:DNA polymerase-3 subunit delta'